MTDNGFEYVLGKLNKLQFEIDSRIDYNSTMYNHMHKEGNYNECENYNDLIKEDTKKLIEIMKVIEVVHSVEGDDE